MAPGRGAVLSRNGVSSPFGKLDASLPKTMISSLTLAELQRQAAQNDMTLAEYVRMILDIRAHGLCAMKRMHDERLERVASIGDGKE